MIYEVMIKGRHVFFSDTASGVRAAKQFGQEMANEYIKQGLKEYLNELVIYTVSDDGSYEPFLEYEAYKRPEKDTEK
jgi:hypothetical protein